MKKRQRSEETEAIEGLKQVMRKGETSKREYIRMKAIELGMQGYSQEEVGKILEVSVSAIRSWWSKYREEGIEGLKGKKAEDGSRAKLKRKEKEEIKEELKKKPKEVGLEEEFWDVKTLRKYIKERYRVEYESTRSYQRILKYCGYSYQRVEYEDKRKPVEEAAEFKERFKKKLKKGTITMWW